MEKLFYYLLYLASIYCFIEAVYYGREDSSNIKPFSKMWFGIIGLIGLGIFLMRLSINFINGC